MSVGVLRCLDPRRMDGRRLLRFLAGLALVALTAALRVDAPADRPAQAAATDRPAQAAATDRPAQPAAAPVPGPAAAAAPEPSCVTVQPARTSGYRSVTAVLGTDASLPAGRTPTSHGSRAPPA
jgi:hypothetical protein